jgi:NADH-quinone oxidoreductase subunit E
LSASFEFTADNLEQAKKIIARYPEGFQASAVMPLLTMAQRQNANHLSVPAIEYIADMLDMPVIRVMEVATFYTMYNLDPVGKHMIEVCTTTPCWLRGSEKIVKACEKALGITVGQTTEDGMFTLKEAECLGACVNAPMCQIGDHYYEDLSEDSMVAIIETLKAGNEPKPGPQIDRYTSAPSGGLTTLTGEPVKPELRTDGALEGDD